MLCWVVSRNSPHVERNVFVRRGLLRVHDRGCVQVKEEGTVVANDRKGLIASAIHLSRLSLTSMSTNRVEPMALRWPVMNQMKRESSFNIRVLSRAHEAQDISNSGMNHRMGEMTSFSDYRTSVTHS